MITNCDRMTFADAAKKILMLNNNVQMHYIDITKESIKLGLISHSKGMTPVQTMRARMGDHPTIFSMLGRGYYKLKEYERNEKFFDINDFEKLIKLNNQRKSCCDITCEEIVNEIHRFNSISKIDLKNEKHFHTQLTQWLRYPFGNNVKYEWQIESSRPDIVIGNTAIEIKGPTKIKDMRSLFDKIIRYQEYWENIIVVLFEVEMSDKRFDDYKGAIEREGAIVIRKDDILANQKRLW